MDFGSILDLIRDLIDRIRSAIESIRDAIWGFLSGIVDGIKNAIMPILQAVSDYVRQLVDSIKDTMTSIMSAIASYVHELVEGLKSVFSQLTDALRGYIESLIGGIKSWLDSAINAIREAVSAIASGIRDALAGAFQQVVDWLKTLVQSVSGWIQQAYQDVGNFINMLIEGLKSAIAGGVETVRGVINQLVTTVENELHKIWLWLQALFDKIADLGARFYNWALKNLAEPATKWVSAQEGVFKDYFGDYRKAVIDPILANPEVPAPIKDMIGMSPLTKTIAGLIFALPAINTLTSSLLTLSLSPQIQRAMNWSMAQWRPGLPDQSDLVTGVRRGLIDYNLFKTYMAKHGIPDDGIDLAYRLYDKLFAPDILTRELRLGHIDQATYEREMAANGYSQDQAGRLAALAIELLNPRDAIALWRRGIISESRMRQELAGAGFIGDRQDLAIRATEWLPPPQDLIRFAVREVYSPEQIKRLQLDQDFPPEFAKEAAKIGLSEETARQYWYAHWELPSPTDVFEMLHRGLLTKEDVDNYLKVADYSPAWRSKLAAISYYPLTRVDIRRMYAAKVIDLDQVKRAYLDLGYDEEKAQWLTDFTKKEYDQERDQAKQPQKDLSRSQIEGAYQRRMIDRPTAKDWLIKLGYDESEADLMLNVLDFDLYVKERDARVDLLTKRYAAGDLDENDLVKELASLGMVYYEIDDVVAKAKYKALAAPKLPSVSELRTMLKKKLISITEFIETLERLGYARKWAEYYTRLAPTEITA